MPLTLTFGLRSLFRVSAYGKSFGDSGWISQFEQVLTVGSSLLHWITGTAVGAHRAVVAAASFEGAGGESSGGVAGFTTGGLT